MAIRYREHWSRARTAVMRPIVNPGPGGTASASAVRPKPAGAMAAYAPRRRPLDRPASYVSGMDAPSPEDVSPEAAMRLKQAAKDARLPHAR